MTEQEFILIVCKEIRQKRLDKAITQVQLANEIGIEKGNLNRIELGRTSPTLKTVFKIAIALQIQPSELLPQIENFSSQSSNESILD